MEFFNIRYIFKWDNGDEDNYNLNLDTKTLEIINPRPVENPDWTKLEYHKCPHCILETDKTPHCPLATNLVQINNMFSHLYSYEKVEVVVVTKERTCFKKTTVQQALCSLMGIVIPCSGCPQASYFKPMARFHLPFASEEETVFRISTMYLMAQYYCNNKGEEADLELKGLYRISRQINEVNNYCTKRLQTASAKDSTVNAVILLDIYAHNLNSVICESLDEYHDLFQPYFK